jgi:RNA polymerase sigma-70 factor, ECF subfamily
MLASVANDTDVGSLLVRVALRDRAAFNRLYTATSAKLFAVTLRLLRNRAEAEDVLQETYVKIWQNAGQYRDNQHSGMAWLTAIARNHAIDRLRRRARPSVTLDEAEELADAGPSPEASAVARSERNRIEECLKGIDTAAAIRGAYLDGFTYDELARRFDVPLNTMKTWLRRGLLKLKECLTHGA